MIFSIDRYFNRQLTYEEVSVLASFFDITGFYGIPSDWMNSGYGDLRNKVRRIIRDLEQRNLLMLEPGGRACVNADLYQILTEISHANKVGRVVYGTQYSKEVVYLYKSDNALAFLKGNNRGGCHIGVVPSKEALLEAISQPSEEDTKEEWIGMLLMEQNGELFKTVYDVAWRERDGGNVSDVWADFVKKIF